MLHPYVIIIISALIGLLAIFKEPLTEKKKDRKAKLLKSQLNIILIILFVSNAVINVSMLVELDKQKKYSEYTGVISGGEISDIKYPIIKMGTVTADIEGEMAMQIGIDPIYVWVQDNKLKISLVIRDEDGKILAMISGNEWLINDDLIFDRNFDDGAIEVINQNGEVVLQVELERDVANLKGVFYIGPGLIWVINDHGIISGSIGIPYEPIQPIFIYPSTYHKGERR